MRKSFCCDASRSAYEDYYMNQSGSGMPVFQGARMQRGHGLGSILSGFFRSAWPIIQSGAKAFGKQFLRTGLQIANDVVEGGENLKQSTLRRIPEGIKAFASSDNFNSQSGGERKGLKQLRKIHNFLKSLNSTEDSANNQSGSGRKRPKRLQRKLDKRFKHDIFDQEEAEEE